MNNQNTDAIHSELVVTREAQNPNLELVNAYQQLGLPVHEIPMSYKFDIRAVNSLVKLIQTRRIDIVHTHGYKSDILGVIAARRAGVKCVATPHGFEKMDDWKLSLFIAIGCRFFRYFDFVAPLSRELCEDIRRYNVPERKIVYIRNGLDLKNINFRLPSENPTRKDKPTVGFIGQMISRKNVTDILGVFDTVASEYPDLRLVLLGDGDALASYQEYATRCTNADKIEFYGFVGNPLDFLTNFDLFVMTSTLEGIPRCLMESMAVGVPVAAYKIPGVDQLIETEKNGLLAPLGEKEQLAECWRRLLFNEQLADQLALSAANTIRDKFSAGRMADEYLSLYRRALMGDSTEDCGRLEVL